MRRLKKDITKRGDVPTSPVLEKKLATPPASNTRSAGRAQTAKTIAAPRATTSKQNATAKGGKKQLGTMLVHQEESDEGQYPLHLNLDLERVIVESQQRTAFRASTWWLLLSQV